MDTIATTIRLPADLLKRIKRRARAEGVHGDQDVRWAQLVREALAAQFPDDGTKPAKPIGELSAVNPKPEI